MERHQEAERFMVLGDRALSLGAIAEGRAYFQAAAEAEAEVYNLVPVDRERTRGITALSVVNLFRQAGQPKEASIRAHGYLADRSLVAWARSDLEDLIQDI